MRMKMAVLLVVGYLVRPNIIHNKCLPTLSWRPFHDKDPCDKNMLVKAIIMSVRFFIQTKKNSCSMSIKSSHKHHLWYSVFFFISSFNIIFKTKLSISSVIISGTSIMLRSFYRSPNNLKCGHTSSLSRAVEDMRAYPLHKYLQLCERGLQFSFIRA